MTGKIFCCKKSSLYRGTAHTFYSNWDQECHSLDWGSLGLYTGPGSILKFHCNQQLKIIITFILIFFYDLDFSVYGLDDN